MKIFAIKDENDINKKTLAWLVYFELTKQFFIELPDDADEWNTPLLLSSFIKRGEHSVNSYWSKIWVQQRIIPTDRQNLGQILKDNGLDEYDEYKLLLISNGRCAQDNYYLQLIDNRNLPKELISRFEKKIEDVIPLSGNRLLIFFKNGIIKKYDPQIYMQEREKFSPISLDENNFKAVYVSPGGNEICWGENLSISAQELYENGTDVPLSQEDFTDFVKNRVINSAEAAELMNCSRQNIDDLISRGKLHPIKTSKKNKLLLKKEIEQRWSRDN